MTFQLVLKTGNVPGARVMSGRKKDVGENVFVSDLSEEYFCYLFYYPGPMPEPELEQALRVLGKQTGKNLLVNIGLLNDPQYDKTANLFEIRRNPVIVLTALAPLSAPKGADLSTYVRLDSPQLLASTKRTMQCVNEIYTLFLRGEVADAIAKGKSRERSELLITLSKFSKVALESLWEFITELEISFSVFDGRLELKRSRG